MNKEQIPFNYFYKMFKEENHKILAANMKNRIAEDEDELYDIFPISNEEKLKNYNESLWNVCANYISLANSKMAVFPQDALDFANNIIDEIEESPYKESLLTSLQFIYQQILESLELGYPTLMLSDDGATPSYCEITLDSQYKIVNFDSINMDLLEQTKTMTKVLTMEKNRQQGPIPKVGYRIRKDI